jgi:hypothetical protein
MEGGALATRDQVIGIMHMPDTNHQKRLHFEYHLSPSRMPRFQTAEQMLMWLIVHRL